MNLKMKWGWKKLTKKESPTKNRGIITMVYVGGIFIMGELVDKNKLRNPRIFQFIDGGNRIKLSPLPAFPSFILFKGEEFQYSVSGFLDPNLLELYYRVTEPQPTAQPKLPQQKKILN